MTELTIEEVRKLAALSKISLTAEEEKTFKKQIEDVFEHIDKLREIDVEGVEPTIQIGDLHNVTRPDEVEDALVDKDTLLNGQENDGSSIKVPRVL